MSRGDLWIADVYLISVLSPFPLSTAILSTGQNLMMSQRITFIHEANHPFDPSQISLQNETLRLNGLNAAREDRLTISLYELPQEVSWNLDTVSWHQMIQVLIERSVMAGIETMS